MVIGIAGIAAVLSNRLSARLRVPAPAFFLICASVAAQLWPRLTALPLSTVERVVSIALAIILFDGGMHIGWRRFRTAAAAIVWVGVAGTLVTAAATAVAAHFVAGMEWRLALLIGTAVAATDPAVVFSVFGRREIAGRTGVLLEGESGANDPVGIALLGALHAAHERQQADGAGHAHGGADRHLQGELGDHVPDHPARRPVRREQRPEQRDPHGIVGAGLTLE